MGLTLVGREIDNVMAVKLTLTVRLTLAVRLTLTNGETELSVRLKLADSETTTG